MKFCCVIRLAALLLIPYQLFVNHVLLGPRRMDYFDMFNVACLN